MTVFELKLTDSQNRALSIASAAQSMTTDEFVRSVIDAGIGCSIRDDRSGRLRQAITAIAGDPHCFLAGSVTD